MKQFYKSKQWRNKREYILKRDGYLCLECKKYGRNKEARIVHHIKELDDFPELKLKNNNLVSVCASCHNKLHPEKGGHRIKF
jgi:5-methylcytosine-specific restriction endonuclease McrA